MSAPAPTFAELARCLPSAEHELLLRAVLDPDPAEAVAAWRRWRERVPFDRIDEPSQRLIPRLWLRLAPLGVEAPELGRYRGLHRWTLYRNHLLFHRAEALLGELQRMGIELLVLKGLPQVMHFEEGDRGARPMNDVDFLVRPEAAPAVMDHFEGRGWTLVDRGSREEQLFVRHSRGYIDEHRFDLDLHWHLLYEACFPGADDEFWRRSVPFRLGGLELRTLCVTDHLFQVLVHGCAPAERTQLRWVVDAMAILSCAGPALDWELLVDLARRLHLSPVVETGLGYLERTFHPGVPVRVLGELGAAARGHLDRRWPDALARPGPRWRDRLWKHWCDYWLRIGHGRGVVGGLLHFPRYLQTCFGHASRRETLGLLARVAGARAWLALTRPSYHIREYRLGDCIDFKLGGDACRYRFGSWLEPEGWATWTGGPVAGLGLRPLERPASGLSLEARVRGFVCPKNPAVDVEVAANGTVVARWELRAAAADAQIKLRSAAIPAACLRDREELALEFRVQGASSPVETGLSRDARQLGIAFVSARLVPL